jgi:hypothetical protein
MTTDDLEGFRLEHAKFLEWERDARNRLNYGLWIVFLGGFVLSLRAMDSQSCQVFVLVLAFRTLAVLGSAVNVFMQLRSIDGLTAGREAMFHKNLNNMESFAEKRAASARYDRTVRACEPILQIITVAFLLVALYGSFVVHVQF